LRPEFSALLIGRKLDTGCHPDFWQWDGCLPPASRLTVIRYEEQAEPMEEKRPQIDYLFRVRDDLDMILQRRPKAPDLIYDACEAALPHVCAAIGYLDPIAPNQNDKRSDKPLRNFEEMFKLSKERANSLHSKISEWLAGRSSDERTSRDILRLIRDDLRKAEMLGDFVQVEIDEALRDICCAIGRLIPPSASIRDLAEPHDHR
jgi:hypothetical protein